MPAKLTHKQYLDKVFQVHRDSIKVIGRYKRSNVPVKHKCINCKGTWVAQPQNIIHKTNPTGCPHCAHPSKKIFDNRAYQDQLNAILPGYKAKSNYLGMNKQIVIECANGHTYKTAARSPLNGHGCGACHHETLADILSIKSKDIAGIIKRRRLPFKLIESTFVSISNIAEFLCDKGHRFSGIPYKVYRGEQRLDCPYCNKRFNQSRIAVDFIEKAQRTLRIRFQHINHGGEKRVKCGDRTFSLDAYNPRLNLGLEFHGVYYHGKKPQLRKGHTPIRKNDYPR